MLFKPDTFLSSQLGPQIKKSLIQLLFHFIIVIIMQMDLSTCGLCQLQIPINNTLSAQIPVYTSHLESLKMQAKKVCKSCHTLLTQIEQFAAHYQIKYCDSHFKSTAAESLKGVVPQPKQSIQLLYASTINTSQRGRADSDSIKLVSKRKSMGEQSRSEVEQQEIVHPYVKYVVEEIKSKNLLCLSGLPKTLQYLIHLSTQQSIKQTIISPEERKQKIKNVVLFLTEKIHLTLDETPYVIVLANFLLCFMEPNKASHIIVRLSDIILTYPNIVSWKTLILDPDMHESKNPQSPASIQMRSALIKVDKLWLRIQSVLELSKRGQSVLHEGTIRIGKLSVQMYKQYRKRLTEILKPLLSKRQEKEQKGDERLSLLYHMKLERNSFSLIIKNMLDSEEEVNQEIMSLNGKFKKQKDQYIDKIIKLNNRIQELQNKINQLQQKNQGSKENPNVFDKINIEDVSEFKLEDSPPNKIENNQNNKPQDVFLQSILTISNLIGFNQHHLGTHSQKEIGHQSSQAIVKMIVQEIEKLQDGFKKLSVKLKHVEEEKTRLLAIVSRKDDRFISVITEKDEIIQRYEQALWKMENGLYVQEEPLAHRIRYIMHIFAKKQRVEIQSQSEDDDPLPSKDQKEKKECDIY